MAASILAALQALNNPIQANRALIIFGLQNDFVGPEAKVRVPVDSGWLERIKEIVPKFRELGGHIIWVRTELAKEHWEFLDSQKVFWDDQEIENATLFKRDSVKEEELVQPKAPAKPKKTKKRNRAMQFLKDMGKKDEPQSPGSASPVVEEDLSRLCLIPGTAGVEFPSDIQKLIQPDDTVVIKSNYSAFSGTDLIIKLRMRIITKLYLVGCMTNFSVLATAQDAATHGLFMNIVEDCLGYRDGELHEQALDSMVEDMCAWTTMSSDILAGVFDEPKDDGSGTVTPIKEEDATDGFDLDAALGRLNLSSHGRSAANSPQAHNEAQSRPPTAGAASGPQSPVSSSTLRGSRSTSDMRKRNNVRVRVRKESEAERVNLPPVPKAPVLHGKSSSREDRNKRLLESLLQARESPGN